MTVLANVPAWFWVAAGGALGALLRYGVALWLGVGASGLPLGTLAVNVLGSLAIGTLWGLWFDAAWFSEWGRPLLVIGLLGGFTTFSAFSLDVLTLFENKQVVLAVTYVGLSVGLCLGAVWLGYWVGEELLRAT